jgi:hypothetical protein
MSKDFNQTDLIAGETPEGPDGMEFPESPTPSESLAAPQDIEPMAHQEFEGKYGSVTTFPTGGTGGTGGAGKKPATEPASPPAPISLTPVASISGDDDDPMRHMLMHFIGSTGAMGGKPNPVKIEAGKPIPQETLQQVVGGAVKQIGKLSKVKTLHEVKNQCQAANGVFNSAHSKMVNINYMIGCLLMHLKKLVIEDGENWGDYTQTNLPEMSRRTIDKCINLANTPGILTHAYLGVDAAEQVIQTISPIKHMLSKEDPIGDLFKRNGIILNYGQIEKGSLKSIVQGVISREKLQKKDMEIDVTVSIDFHKLAGAVTAVDVAVMLDRKEHGLSPQGYMEEVIANNGTRPNEVSRDTSSKPPIKYINAETVKLKSSIDRLLENGLDIKKLDKTHLEALKTAVDNLLGRFPK